MLKKFEIISNIIYDVMHFLICDGNNVHILCSQTKKCMVKIILYVTFIPILFRPFKP